MRGAVHTWQRPQMRDPQNVVIARIQCCEEKEKEEAEMRDAAE